MVSLNKEEDDFYPTEPQHIAEDGFSRQLPDNCVEYMLFLIDQRGGPKAQKTTTLLSALEAIKKEAIQVGNELTSLGDGERYIWQRSEGFRLELRSRDGLAYLWGSTDYGDAVEDEWLVVYLLRELSRRHPDDLWIRVSDTDGEFLLVEAANVLPRWLSPEIDANRAWLHDGKLRIIPLASSTSGSGSSHDPPKRGLTLSEAVGAIRSGPESLIHSPLIEAEALYRLEKYPAHVRDSMHHSLVTIPRKLAYILHDRPAAVAPAVEAFYLRDPVSMKPLLASSAEGSALEFPPDDLVTASVQFTKVLFAQLKSQRFDAPPSWQGVVGSEADSLQGSEETQKRYARLEMGMKLAGGFEMLATSAARHNSRVAREVAIVLEDLREDGDGAVLPTDAEIKTWKGIGRDDDESWMDIDYEDFEKELQGRQVPGGSKPAAAQDGGFGDANAQADLRKIVSRFEAFLNDESAGIDGAEVDEMDEDDDSDDFDEEEDSEDEDKDVSFDEEEFARMMREMMGLPSDRVQTPVEGKEKAAEPRGLSDDDDSQDEDEDEEIRKLMVQMESELNEHGALALDPTPKKLSALKGKAPNTQSNGGVSEAGKGKEIRDDDDDDGGDEEESGEEGVDIDYNLAKNLLESFKGQAGMAGPAGNIMSMMGMRLPRDEDDEEESK